MTLINGKTFRDGKGADNTQHYGKAIFAHKVVKPNAEIIDFKGFVPLLNNVVAALKHHYAAMAETEASAIAAVSGQ
jgi:RNA-directed DNA polymerase